MRAVQVVNPGPESRLKIGEVPTPVTASNEVLIKVEATALNRADLLQRLGKYPPPKGASEILGLEVAGTIVQTSPECTYYREGDRVIALLSGGGYAEYVAVPYLHVMRLPDELSFDQGAAIPEVFLTAHQALFQLGRLLFDDHVLIHAGASGVGTAAIQLAKHTDAKVYVTASKAKHDKCLALGADLAIDYKSEDFEAVILEKTEGRGVDLVIDFVGAPYFKKNLGALAMDGQLVLLAMMGGSKIEQLNLRDLFKKRIQVKTSTLRSRSLSYKAELVEEFWTEFGAPLFSEGKLKPVIDRVFDWHEVEKAHAYMASNQNVGKIVMRVR